MLTVQTYLAPSKIHGIGLFASQFIPKGTMVWRFNPYIDHVYTKQKFIRICKTLDESALRHLISSCYIRNNRCFYITDNARFINHADNSYNVSLIDDYSEIAVRDIHVGEELVENYYLCYDEDDFFFQEFRYEGSCSNLEEHLTVEHVKAVFYANNKNVSR